MLRMKSILLIALLFTGGGLLAQQVTVNVTLLQRKAPASSDSIYYTPGQPLTWADFKGSPQPGSPAVAVTHSGFGFGMGSHNRNGHTTLNITVYCHFSKQRSWVKTGYATPYVLNHEQHHFDLTWYCTLLFYKKLQNARFTGNNTSAVVTAAYNECATLMQQLQDEYDSATKNGILKDQQAVWNKKIDDWVKQETMGGGR
jgi:hypothetical protein